MADEVVSDPLSRFARPPTAFGLCNRNNLPSCMWSNLCSTIKEKLTTSLITFYEFNAFGCNSYLRLQQVIERPAVPYILERASALTLFAPLMRVVLILNFWNVITKNPSRNAWNSFCQTFKTNQRLVVSLYFYFPGVKIILELLQASDHWAKFFLDDRSVTLPGQ